MKYDKQIENISNLGKQKRFSKKIELDQEDYESLTQYAKKGIVADKEKQDELERQRLEQEKIQAERKAREETKEKARIEKQKLKNSPEYKKRRADRDAR